MKSAEQILDQALKTYKPSLIVCSYSGGYDSMVATHKALEWAKHSAHSTNIVTIAVDTRIHADGWRDYVTSSAKSLGAKRFEIWQTTMLEKWVADVQERGFAYRPHQHKIYFYYLKQNAFRAVVSHYKKHKHDRIMFVTGVRRSESKARANTPEWEQTGSNVWVHPLVRWTEQDIHEYRFAHDFPENPFYALTNNSGDCLCNWHTNISIDTLQKAGKEAAKTILPLNESCLQNFGYGYGQEPSQYLKQEKAGQLKLFDDNVNDIPNLCASCERPKANAEITDELLMQRWQWGNES